MPNHVTNIVEITGHEQHVQDVMNAVKFTNENGEVEEFSFEGFLPMPEELRHVTSPTRIVTKKEYEKEIELSKDKEHPFGFSHSITKQMSKEYKEKFGADNWYDWAIQNWGTKWGCYDVEVENNGDNVRIVFLTAWSGAHHAIEKLSRKFPYVTINLTFADEDCGHNVAKLTYKEGSMVNANVPEGGTNEAFEIYFEVCNPDREGWELKDGEWEYVDF